MVQIYNTLPYIFTNSLANCGNIADTEIQNFCILDVSCQCTKLGQRYREPEKPELEFLKSLWGLGTEEE